MHPFTAMLVTFFTLWGAIDFMLHMLDLLGICVYLY